MSIVTRLVLLVLAAVLPVAGLQAHSAWQVAAQRQAEMAGAALRLAQLVAADQASMRDGIRTLLGTLAAVRSVRTGEAGRCQELLGRAGHGYPAHLSVAVAGGDGRVFCSTEPRALGVRIDDRAYFREAMATGGFVVGAAVRRRSTGEPALPLALPLPEGPGGPAGVVVATLSLSWLDDYLARRPLPDGASLLVADRDGTVLHAPGAGMAEGGALPAAYAALAAAGAPGTAEVRDADGPGRLVAYLPPGPGTGGLFIAVAVDKDAALAGVADAGRLPLLTLALSVLATLAAARWLGQRHLRDPVDGLARAAARVGAGDLSARAPARGMAPEFRSLAGAFDRMAATLEARSADRDRAEAALRASEARLAGRDAVVRAVLESTGEYIYAKDLDGRYLLMSRAVAALHGRPAQACLGLTDADLFPPDVAAALRANDRAVLASGQAGHWEECVGEGDARRRFLSTKAPLLGPGGDCLGVVGVSLDMTERQRVADRLLEADRRLEAADRELALANARVREQLQELEAVYANAPVGLWLGDRDCRFLRVNGVMAEINGLPAGAQVGRLVRDVVPGVYEAVRPHYERVLATGAAVTFEVRGTTPARPGVAREWVVTYYPLKDEAGAVHAVSGLVREVTEERQAARALAEAKDAAEAARAEAEEANRAKSRFLAAASHDLRQPVQSMMLFAGVLEGRVTPEGREPLLHLARGLDALKGMLDGLLDVSRLEAGAVSPRVRDFDLGDLLAELSAAYGAVAEARGLRFEVCGCASPVRSDRVLLGRMLRNLLENAMRYTEPGGSIRLACAAGDGKVLVSVEDTGVGIPAEHQRRIFDEFHQVGNAGRNREEGLGLGLAIVRRLSRLLGHPVRVASEVGRGSSFTLEVPLAMAAAAVPPAAPTPVAAPPPAADAGGQGRLALVVDDDAIVLLGLKQMLEAMGYGVVIAADPDQAGERARRAGRWPDLVVTDYRLRDGRLGTEAVALVRALAGHDIPGLVLTGEAGPEAARDAAALGLGLVHKPVTPRQLAQALAREGLGGQGP